MKNGAAGKKNSRNSHFPKGTPVVQPRFYQAGKKCGEKNRVRPNLGTTFTERPGEKCRFFFFPSRFLRVLNRRQSLATDLSKLKKKAKKKFSRSARKGPVQS